MRKLLLVLVLGMLSIGCPGDPPERPAGVYTPGVPGYDPRSLRPNPATGRSNLEEEAYRAFGGGTR